MSDEDPNRASAPLPSNCVEPSAASLDDRSVLDSVEKKGNLSQSDELREQIVSPEANKDTPHLADHGITKVKQRKSVQFNTSTSAGSDDDTLRKFIEGEEILDKKNPFKFDEYTTVDVQHLLRRQKKKVQDKNGIARTTKFVIDERGDGVKSDDDGGDDDDNDDVFVTKEEVLRQSKYVKTYIKNPDKQLNYDKSIIQKLDAIKAKGREVRDVAVVERASSPVLTRPPIPAPRAIYRQGDRINNQRHDSPQMERGGNPKPTPRARRDYAEVKVRIGSAEAEESLYDSNEVVQNALKFDSRFRKVEFGSQDDIDTIAERTDGTDADAENQANRNEDVPDTGVRFQNNTSKNQQKDGKKSKFTEDAKKSFSNTVKSADFRKYLQSKGLSLVPAKPKTVDSPHRSKNVPDGTVKDGRLSSLSTNSAPTPRRQQKPSMLTRIFQNGRMFTPKTSNDPAYSPDFVRSSNPVLVSSQKNPSRTQLPARYGSFNGSLNRRQAAVVDVKPKVSFNQLVEGNGDVIAPRRPASVNDFDRPKLRAPFANRTISSVDSLKRPTKNACVQVNFVRNDERGAVPISANQLVRAHHSWQPEQVLIRDTSMIQQQQQITYQTMRPRPDSRMYGGSSYSVAPLYSEPLRDASIRIKNEGNVEFRPPTDNGYHIYEQTPDNLRKSEMVYGKIGYLGNSQLIRRPPQDRRSYSSMQEGMTSVNGTYGRLRPLYVSSPLSTQSTPVRRASDVIDREQILNRIYDFCRRSIRNSSKTSIHSNQTEPLYQSHVPNGRMTNSGSFPIERQRVQRVQSLTHPRTGGVNYSTANYTRTAVVPVVPTVIVDDGNGASIRRNQHDRNIENIYAFMNKKMVQNHTNGAVPGVRPMQTSAPSTLRRVMFSQKSPGQEEHGFDEADYVNIRGAPDGIQYRTTQC